MALQLLLEIEFTQDSSNPSPIAWNWSQGDIVRILYDDSLAVPSPLTVEGLQDNMVVEINGSVESNGQFLPGYNVNDPSGNVFLIRNTTGSLINENLLLQSRYSYCAGAQLVEFGLFALGAFRAFPYADPFIVGVSPVCQAQVVCDLTVSVESVQNVSSPGGTDGSITVSGSTSATGDVFYSFDEPSIFGGSNSTGIFQDLIAGNYRIWAIDSNGCTAFTDIIINDGFVFQPLYRLDYQDINNKKYRLDIEQEGYTGSINDLIAGAQPFSIRYDYSAAFKYEGETIPSSASLQLISETNFQFFEFFTANERKFRVRHYVDRGSGVVDYQLDWAGFVLPEDCSEPYSIDRNYTVDVVASDGLALLSNYEFLDSFGNRLIEIISIKDILVLCLRKLDTSLDLRISVNKYEETFSSSLTEDPFAQAFIDPAVYYNDDGEPDNCLTVINNVLAPFGAILTLRSGYWWVVDVQELKKEVIPYRRFNSEGIFQDNGTIDPRVNSKGVSRSDRLFYTAQSAVLDMQPIYRSVELAEVYDLNNNLIKNGRFTDTEEDNITPRFWEYRLNGDTGIQPRTGVGDFSGIIQGEGNAFLVQAFTMSYQSSDTFRFSFDYKLNLTEGNLENADVLSPAYLIVRCRVQMGTRYLNSDGTWTTAASDIIIRTDKFREVVSFEVESQNIGENASNVNCTVRLYSVSSWYSDVFGVSVTDMVDDVEALSTDGEVIGKRIIAAYPNPVAPEELRELAFYELQEQRIQQGSNFPAPTVETLRSGVPDNIIPDDYDETPTSGFNPNYWSNEDDNYGIRLISNVNDSANRIVQYGNVELSWFPEGQDPEQEQNITFVNFEESRRQAAKVYRRNYLHTDILTNIANNGYSKVFRNYLRKSDGTPTFYWFRKGVTERKRLIKILSEEIGVEYRTPKRRVTGTLSNLRSKDVEAYPLTVVREENDSNRLYFVASLGRGYTSNYFEIEGLELSEDNPAGGDGSGSSFSSAFKRNEFD